MSVEKLRRRVAVCFFMVGPFLFPLIFQLKELL